MTGEGVTKVVIGIDPGPTPGLVLLEVGLEDGTEPTAAGLQLMRAEVVQCSAGALWPVLRGLDPRGVSTVAVERFVVGPRAARSSSANAGQITRDQVGGLVEAYEQRRIGYLLLRNAGQVKPWATDARLEAAGLLDLCKGMRHARDAARHALFAACKNRALTDPLGSSWAHVIRTTHH